MPVGCPGRGHRANSQSRSSPETGERHHTSVRNPRPTLFGRAWNRAPMSARAVAVIPPASPSLLDSRSFASCLAKGGQLHAFGDVSFSAGLIDTLNLTAQDRKAVPDTANWVSSVYYGVNEESAVIVPQRGLVPISGDGDNRFECRVQYSRPYRTVLQ